MSNAHILWVDDEIDHLKPHILFLEGKGLRVTARSNGEDALDFLREQRVDLIFLDEQMPGLSGLEVLSALKPLAPHTPVVMITKSEEEHLMEDALGARIADYLIKPVNPNQILLSIKKLLDGAKLVRETVNRQYREDFRSLAMALSDNLTPAEWMDHHRKLVYWDLELDEAGDPAMREVLESQKQEANGAFCRYVMRHYLDWMGSERDHRPRLSQDVMAEKVFPLLGDKPVFLLVIDGMRYDQWKLFERLLAPKWEVVDEDAYFSILPTATQYARNALFAGLPPLDIAERYPKLWVDEDDETGKNLRENELLGELIARRRLKARHSYTKLLNHDDGRLLVEKVKNLGEQNALNAVVVNFIDMVAHARSEFNLIKELAPDEAAYRALSRNWLAHSHMGETLDRIRDLGATLVVTADHGMTAINKPLKVVGDRQTTSGLRFKQGRNLNYDAKSKQIFTIKNPKDARLPQLNLTNSFIFAAEGAFFVYPNNYNHYVKLYDGTFQHGGISLDEMVVPLVTLRPKA